MSNKGMVFDIQRFSLHDGPGIRTTVFLKGCPLRCIWCHNPESWSIGQQLLYIEEKCNHCMACTMICPRNAHKNVDGIHIFNRSLCTNCGECVKACNYNALLMSGQMMDVEDVISEAMKDKAYYEHSGGGITISGGEPTFQYDFCLALLKKSKESGLHTCIETCGMASTERYTELAKHVNLFLFDIKETNSFKHLKFTGAGNELILKNVELLCSLKAEIILRSPMIPGLNNTNDNINAIVALANKYESIKSIEILSYHDYGRKKWKEAGKTELLSEIKMFNKSEIKEIILKFKKAGILKPLAYE